MKGSSKRSPSGEHAVSGEASLELEISLDDSLELPRGDAGELAADDSIDISLADLAPPPEGAADFEIVIEDDAPASRSSISFASVSAHASVASLAEFDTLSIVRSAALSEASTIRIRVPAGRLGHYDLVRKLGEGAMGRVFEATDVRTGQRVALKMLLDIDLASVFKLKREFRRMSDIVHHNLVTLYELVVDEQACFFTMEYVAGVNFRAAVQDDPGPAHARLRGALEQLTYGVHALHEAGRVHRDLKPHNVLVTPEGRVVVLDFGLAREVEQQTIFTTQGGLVQGTPAYMAPEQVAGQLATPATDWYAVGGMLYELLAGRLPFEGRVMNMLISKQYDEPPPLQRVAPRVDPALAELVTALLHRDPEQRPGPAELLSWCAGASDRRAVARMIAQPRARTHLIDRDAQLDALRDALAEVATGQPACVDIKGPSGSGKSALVSAFLEPLRGSASALILETRCSEREAVPYRALDGIVDGLAAYLRTLSTQKRRAVTGDRRGEFAALCRIFPMLLRAEPGTARARPEPPPPRAEAVARHTAFGGLKRLLFRVAQRRTLILVIDDLHRGDHDSARLLVELLSPPSVPPFLLIATIDEDAPADVPILLELEHMRALRSPPYTHRTLTTTALSRGDAIELALQLMGGPRTPAAELRARAIAAESAGNPMLVEALARASDPAAPPGEARDDARDSVSSIGQGGLLRRLITTRLRALHPAARELLALFTASRGALGIDVIRRAMDAQADPSALLAQLRGSRLLRVRDERGALMVETYHERIRVAIRKLVGQDNIRVSHLRLAQAMDALQLDEPELLAYHYSQAGVPAEAAEHASQAAYAAAKHLAFDHAAELYALAVACRPDSWTYRRRCADALVKAGRGEEAAEYYVSAAELAPARAAPALENAAAEQFLVNGHIERGLAMVGPLLASHGIQLPTDAQINALFAKYADRLARRGPSFKERSEIEIHRSELDLLDLLWVVGRGLLLNDPIRGGYFLMRNACHALDVGEPHRIARCLALVGLFPVSKGARERVDVLDVAERIARSLRDDYVMGLASICRGVRSRNTGKWIAALSDLEFGVDHLRENCSGTEWECSLAMRSILGSLEALGEIRSLAHRTQQFHQQAQASGGVLMGLLAAMSSALERIASDNPREARARVRSSLAFWPRTGFHVQHLEALKIEVLCDLYQGRPEDAWRRVASAWPAIEASNFLRLPSRRIEALLLRARSTLAHVAHAPRRRGRLLTVVEQDLTQLEREGHAFARGHASLLRAGLHALYGDADATRRQLQAATEAFDAAGMLLMAACARWCRGRWTDDEEGQKDMRKAEAYMAMQTIVAPVRWVQTQAPALVDAS